MNKIVLLVVVVIICLSSSLIDGLMVGKWKLNRKIPKEGPNRCYVDMLTFYEDKKFELIFKTLINNEERSYNYYGKVNLDGEAHLVLGDSIAYLKNFNQIENRVDFRFEYGEKLGMFCTREQHPYPHKHLPHDLVGQRSK